MKFEVPDNCGSCLSKQQFGNIFICGMPMSKEKEMLDISCFEVDLNSRPDWCPKIEAVEIVNKFSEEDKVVFEKICDGFSAMFELIDHQKEKINNEAD